MPEDLNFMAPTATEKGGGFRGGPRRWTGNGPRPARHVPWPEIFKHHISVLEGHFKMLDMVRKHTVEGTGNHRTICTMVQRTQESLRQIKDTQRNFVSPNTRDRVPIGSSSASMYPGYSPADITYGQAAEEVGQQWSQAKKDGLELRVDGDGLEYEIGQSRGVKRKKMPISELKKKQEEDAETKMSAELYYSTNGAESTAKGNDEVQDGQSGTEEEGNNPYFIVDTNPTPVKLSDPTGSEREKKTKKRKVDQENREEPEKKKKKRREAEMPSAKPEKKMKKNRLPTTEELSTAEPPNVEKKRKADTQAVGEGAAAEPEKKKKKKKPKKANGVEKPLSS